MRSVAPRIGYPEVTLAEDQHEFYALTAALVPYEDGTVGVATRWRLSDDERSAIAGGEDVFLILQTADGRPQPVAISVGNPFKEEGS